MEGKRETHLSLARSPLSKTLSGSEEILRVPIYFSPISLSLSLSLVPPYRLDFGLYVEELKSKQSG
jgi:hypothetical protein